MNLTRPWSESAGVTQLYQLFTDLTHRATSFVGTLITVVLGLIAITSTVAVAGVALQESLQRADFVQNWHYNSHLLWQQQHDIDTQLETDKLIFKTLNKQSLGLETRFACLLRGPY